MTDATNNVPSNVDYPQITLGIIRNMELTPPVEPRGITTFAQGGGDLNGSANTALLLGHAGTAADRPSVPRQNLKAGGGNYCGTV